VSDIPAMKSMKIRVAKTGEAYSVDLFRLKPDNKWKKIAGEDRAILGFDPVKVSDFVSTQRGPSSKLARHGEALGHFLFPERIWATWDRESRPFRTYLEIQPTELAMVPWEIANREGFRFLDPDRTLIRAHNLRTGGPIDEIWPVRLLLVIGSDDGDIKAEEEAIRISRMLRPKDRTYHVKELRYPSREQLGECLQKTRPHILHFVGHCEESNGRVRLRVLDGSEREVWFWTRDDIRADLAAAGQAPRFIYLNACRTFVVRSRVHRSISRELRRSPNCSYVPALPPCSRCKRM
jgi:hypothetical protein